MKNLQIESVDGYKLDVCNYPVEKPKAVVQLVHGMEEHQDRYKDFALFLNANGYAVVTSNLRGHGKNAPTLGYFAKKGGHKLLICDQVKVYEYIIKQYKDIPVYLFAHSFGTIISRVLLQTYSNCYKKVVLSGYPNYQSATSVGIFIAGVIGLFRGKKHKAKFISNLSIGAFNKNIPNAKTNVDWVCANEQTIQNYLKDPLCGFGFTASAFRDMFRLVKLMHKPKKYKNVNTNLKLLLIAGAQDPCTGYQKGRADSQEVLKKAGFISIDAITYQGMRHEILNEVDNKKVYSDVLEFYDK